MKMNEHRACGCKQCRRGAGRQWGQFIHRYVNRQIRKFYRMALKKDPSGESLTVRVFSTPYTD